MSKDQHTVGFGLVVAAILAINLWQRGAWGLFTPIAFLSVFGLTVLAKGRVGTGWAGWARVATVQWLFVAGAVGFLSLYGTIDWWLVPWLALMAWFSVWAFRQAA